MADLYVNGAFAAQRITGQQRYASEVSARLVARGGVAVRPPPWVATRAALSHAWAHTVLPRLSASGSLVSLTARSPVIARRHVVVVHDLFVIEHPEWYSRAYVRTHRPVLAAQLRHASALVAVSPWVAERVEALVPGKPTVVAPNAPSEVFSHPSPEALPREVRLLLEDRRTEGFFFAVGSRDPRKNFARMVAAYGLLPEPVRRAFPLLIAGVESKVFASDSVEEAAGVTWLGDVDDTALAALYAGATAVLVPSLAEGFGLPVVEALAAGGRVAVSDIEPFRWIAGDGARYFDPVRVEDIARAMAAMVSDPPGTVEAVALSERFTWEASAAVIADLVASLP